MQLSKCDCGLTHCVPPAEPPAPHPQAENAALEKILACLEDNKPASAAELTCASCTLPLLHLSLSCFCSVHMCQSELGTSAAAHVQRMVLPFLCPIELLSRRNAGRRNRRWCGACSC